MCGARIAISVRNPFIGEKLYSQREEANEQNPCAVVIVKRTTGVLRIKVTGHGPIGSSMYSQSFSKVEISNIQ